MLIWAIGTDAPRSRDASFHSRAATRAQIAVIGVALGALGLMLGLAFLRYVLIRSNPNGDRASLTSSIPAASDADNQELAAMSELAVSRYRARPPPAMEGVEVAL